MLSSSMDGLQWREEIFCFLAIMRISHCVPISVCYMFIFIQSPDVLYTEYWCFVHSLLMCYIPHFVLFIPHFFFV